MPKISVIIPVYNVEKYLRECLDSVRAQTFTDFEVICVDDGSTDNSPAILDEYAANDKRFRVIHHTNAGDGGASNAGIAAAIGDCNPPALRGKYANMASGQRAVELRIMEAGVR